MCLRVSWEIKLKLSQKQIEELIFEISGNEGLAVYKLLKDKIDVNEFSIAEKLKLTINQIRNIFYKFQAYNLVTSTSRKDRKKGWYIYFFTFNPMEAGSAYLILKKEKLSKIEQRMNKEKAHEFYVCPNKDMRATLENAMEHNFTCIECGQLLVPEDNAKAIVKMENEVEELRKEIALLEKEDVKHAIVEGLTIPVKEKAVAKKVPVKAAAKKAVKKVSSKKVEKKEVKKIAKKKK